MVVQTSKSYHHGALKERLLTESAFLLRDFGVAKITLRQVASRAGVSHTAAYRHFKDKNELLAELCVSIYKRIADRIRYFSLKGFLPEEQLIKGASVWLKYCLEHPADFHLLRMTRGDRKPQAGVQQAVEELVAACGFKKVEPRQAALLLEAQVFGMADLVLSDDAKVLSRKQSLALHTATIEALIEGWKK